MTDTTNTEQSARYLVPGMTCRHCELSVREEVGGLADIESVEVDLERKLVTVRGRDLDDRAIRAAIDKAGYEAVIA